MAASLLIAFISCNKEQDWYNAGTTTPDAAISETELVLDGKSESAEINLATNMWWKARVEYPAGTTDKWCILEPDHGFGKVQIKVTSTRNYLEKDRSAVIVVEGDDQNTHFRKEFTVTQKASNPYVEITGMEGTELKVPIVRSINTVAVKSNNEWTATSDKDWCKVTGSGAKGDGSLEVECQINTTGAVRTAQVNIVSKTNSAVTGRITVIQSEKFDAAVLQVEKTPTVFKATWTSVVGAAKYEIHVLKSDGTESVIDAGVETSCDLAADPLFATPEYAGHVALSIVTVSEDPSVFSTSNTVEANSHFTSGKGTAADPFVIGDKESLANIGIANKVLPGACYKLSYVPEMGGFTPLCSAADPFAGNFDGDGKTISGWKPTVMADEDPAYGFFRAVAEGASVKNLKFSGCTLSLTKGEGSVSSSNNGMGFVAGINAGEISDITLNECSVSTEAGTSPITIGAVAGQNSGKVLRCSSAGGRLSAAEDRNKSDEFNCGGIVGYNTATGEINGCTNANEIIAMNIVGGIAGYNDGKIVSCGNKGKITANYYFGGVAGYVKTTGKGTFKISKCYNTGTLVMDEPAGFGRGAAYVGGIVSRVHSTGTAVEQCFNSGELIIGTTVSSSAMRIGGIVGHMNNTGTVTDCYFCGNATIAGNANYGGIVGEFADKACTIQNCYSVGKLTKTETAGGILNDGFGKCAKSAKIKSCYALSNGGSAFIGGTTTNVSSECAYKTDAELKTQSTFSGWVFSTVWKIGGSYAYPQLVEVPHM